MLHAGLDLSRRRLDVCLLDEEGLTVEERTAPPDRDGLGALYAPWGVTMETSKCSRSSSQ